MFSVKLIEISDVNNFYEAKVENTEMIQQKFDVLGNSLLVSTVKRIFFFFFLIAVKLIRINV